MLSISWRANRIKNDATLEELRAIVAGLEREPWPDLSPQDLVPLV
jgi:hypothetical protein